MKQERQAFFLFYDKGNDFLWTYVVRQTYNREFEDWVDDEEPHMCCGYKFVNADKTENPKFDQPRPQYLFCGLVNEICEMARWGWTFLGYRQTTDKLG